MSKVANFAQPRVFTPRWGSFRWNFVTAVALEKI